MNENNVTSKRGGTEENDLNMRRGGGTSNFDTKIQCYTMQKREQRNKSLQGNAMSRCSSYKLINEKYSIKLANHK